MSVILFEPTLEALLDSEDGPVGQFIAEKAALVAAQAATNANTYFRGVVDLSGDIDFVMQGSSAVVGIKNAGNKTRRFAQKDAEGAIENGLREALDAARE